MLYNSSGANDAAWRAAIPRRSVVALRDALRTAPAFARPPCSEYECPICGDSVGQSAWFQMVRCNGHYIPLRCNRRAVATGASHAAPTRRACRGAAPGFRLRTARRCFRAVVRRTGVRLGRVRGVLGLLPHQQAERGRPAQCRPRPSLAPLLFRLARSRGRCGRGEPSPGADVAGVRPVPAQMWPGRARSRRRCGRGEPSPGADVARVGPVPAQMWHGWAQSRRRCGDSPRIRMVGCFRQGSAVVATCFCLKNCGLLPLPADWRLLVPAKEYARYGECAALRAARTQTNIHTTRCVSRRRAT
jgi:hypothetical protein